MTSRMPSLMQSYRTLGMLLCAALLAMPQLSVADTWRDDVKTVNCHQNASLAEAIARADHGDTLIIKGVCKGPITITNDQLTLDGLGSGAIDGDEQDVVTINTARQVTLRGLEIRHGAYGLIANGVAQLTLTNVTSQHNAISGMLMQGSSSVTLAESSAQHNGHTGIDVEGSSSATFTGNIVTSHNGIFGIAIGTASNATFSQANVVSTHNILGIQAGNTSNIFITDPGTTITANDNAAMGVTIVSGSHLFDFGGRIICFNNGLRGVYVTSRSGIEVDAAGSIVSYNNAGEGVLVQKLSLLNIFNAPQSSGVQGISTVEVYQNARNGISALGNSVVSMFNQAKILSQQNGAAGLFADDGSSLFVTQSTVTANATSDILLRFGARADLTLNTIGQIHCDQTSLIRGDTGAVCPQ
jgi:parallel beta-helix repeat protein